MGQRLDRGHAYKGGNAQVGHAYFIAVILEIGPEQGMGFPIEGFHILEAPRAWNLLCKDAMQFRVDPVASIATATSLRTAFLIGCEATSASAPRTTCISSSL